MGRFDTNTKWDKRFFSMAEMVAKWSRDPSTKCGAVITWNKRVVSVGFNGFAQGVEDLDTRYANRDLKLKMVLHAEENALEFADRSRTGCHLYVIPMPPCSHCASLIIQSGIVSHVFAIAPNRKQRARWGEHFELTADLFHEAGIQYRLYNVQNWGA